MDYFDLLKNRRAIRDYEDKKVSSEIIQEIINDAVKAPNAGNRQIWSFIIVNNKDLLKRISDSNKRAMLNGIERNPDSPMKVYEKALRNENYNVFYNAPCVVFIIGPAKAPTTAVDCALVASYLMPARELALPLLCKKKRCQSVWGRGQESALCHRLLPMTK